MKHVDLCAVYSAELVMAASRGYGESVGTAVGDRGVETYFVLECYWVGGCAEY